MSVQRPWTAVSQATHRPFLRSNRLTKSLAIFYAFLMAAEIDSSCASAMNIWTWAAQPANTRLQTPPEIMKESGNSRLEVNVLFTTEQGTRVALETASRWALDLGARINLIALRSVPWALPLTRPEVSTRWTERRLLKLVGEAALPDLETDFHQVLCRNKRRVLLKLFRPNSLLVIGGKKSWWPSEVTRAARLLERAGHRVIFAGER